MILAVPALLMSLLSFSILPNPLLQRAVGSMFSTSNSHTTKITYELNSDLKSAEKKVGSSKLNQLAKASLVIDAKTNQQLSEKEANIALPMASLTKMMTALVILDNHNLDEVVTIPDNLPSLGPVDQKIGVKPGERFYLKDLMSALLIYSANDVANALAVWDSGSEKKFVDKMNVVAKRWGMNETHFINPSGLDAEGHNSSTKDLALMGRLLINSPKTSEIVKTKSTNITSIDGNKYILTNTNKNLVYPNIYGIKTGQTEAAGQSLLLLAKDKDGNEIITVVLNSPDRFAESKNMVDWVLKNYQWR